MTAAVNQWFYASRPKTLVAGIFPVLLGGCLAYSGCNKIDFFLLGLCLLFSILIQIGTNFSNDYFDFIKGADRNRSIAPERFASSGAIRPESVRNASHLVLVLGFFVGIIILLVSDGSSHLIWIGIASIASAILYTGGPKPIAYNGLGDIFVILFYGLVAVEVTHYVLLSGQSVHWALTSPISLGMGCVINTILVINNYRDYQEDLSNKKRTLIVLLGKPFGVYLYFLCLLSGTLLCPFFDQRTLPVLLILPLGVFCGLKLKRLKTKFDYDNLLKLNVLLVSLYGFLSCVGVVFL
ncbi:MAG: 1,4-dihydroxy-2-naphthoate octaprenyltransferase [Opitutales bacterium]|nr:1,4-dihydroxy-2-naphthoate octaprenyltransferase [Opitutales bacterium]